MSPDYSVELWKDLSLRLMVERVKRGLKVSDNRTFWKSVKPFFPNKRLNSDNILLVEENEIINDDGKLQLL